MTNVNCLIASVCLCLFAIGCGEKAKQSPVKIGAVPETPPKSISRANVEATIRLFAKNLGERYRTDAKWAERFKADDPESVNEILRPACKENGLSQEEYEWALQEDKGLAALQKQLVSDAIIGPIDPAKESLGAKKPE